ncbi:MAG: hypothetical protein KBS81_09625 [Spirochaetales bacterium]|nr:hypothetical protein [Candidatus Physcosoma equi]
MKTDKRRNDLRKIHGYSSTPTDLEHAMMAVCAGLDSYRTYELAVRLIAEEFCQDKKRIYEALEVCNLLEGVWEEFSIVYNYSGASVRDLVVHLYEGSYNRTFIKDLNDFVLNLKIAIPKTCDSSLSERKALEYYQSDDYIRAVKSFGRTRDDLMYHLISDLDIRGVLKSSGTTIIADGASLYEKYMEIIPFSPGDLFSQKERDVFNNWKSISAEELENSVILNL